MHTTLTRAITRVTAASPAADITAEFIFPKDAPIFAGHFPGMPVIPAVYQVGLCRMIVGRFVPSAFFGVARSRFSKMCLPGVSYEITISLSRTEHAVSAACSIHRPSEKTLHSKIVLLFSP